MDNIKGLVFAALWVSECWYDNWRRHPERIHSKARAMVLYDRVLNQEVRNI